MTARPLMFLGEVPGFSPQIGRLVSMLTYVRHTTLTAVAGLSVPALDYVHDPQSNSIGALLAHIAAAEAGYQVSTFESRDLNPAEQEAWGAALALGEPARKQLRGHELSYYLHALEQVRARTLGELRRRSDAWLDESTAATGGQNVNNYFKWFHVLTHEVNHRGQIRWLRARATGGQ